MQFSFKRKKNIKVLLSIIDLSKMYIFCLGIFSIECHIFIVCWRITCNGCVINLCFIDRWGGRWCRSGGPQGLWAYSLPGLFGRASQILPRTVQWEHQRGQNGSGVFQGAKSINDIYTSIKHSIMNNFLFVQFLKQLYTDFSKNELLSICIWGYCCLYPLFSLKL